MRKTKNGQTQKERVFSVELKSKLNLKSINVNKRLRRQRPAGRQIGELVHATFKEGVILEVKGKNGTFRIDLKPGEIKTVTLKTVTKGVYEKNDAK